MNSNFSEVKDFSNPVAKTILDEQIELWTAFTEECGRILYSATPDKEEKLFKKLEIHRNILNSLIRLKNDD